MDTCPKCGKEPKDKNNFKEYFLENRGGKVNTETLCKFCN